MTLSRCWTATTCDISTAFLHAPMTERILMKPPSEYYPTGNCWWLLKRAMYGLKQAPALWQTHFAKVMTELGFHRCKTDSNLYCHKSTELYVLCYVDDLRQNNKMLIQSQNRRRNWVTPKKKEENLKDTRTNSSPK